MLKKTVYALLALFAVLVLLLLGARWWLGRSAAPTGDDTIAGLGAPVEVWRDSLGVPHLWARDEADLFRALGYVHAQDRLFQMEMFRRMADGRLSEILGGRMVETDKFLRTVGLGRAAGESERRLSPDERRLLQAYADGVNAWIGGHRGPLPPEFVTLRFAPEPWTVRNSLSIGKIMAWDLADFDLGLDLQAAVARVGEALGRDLYPTSDDTVLTIVGADGQWKGKGAASPAPASPAPRTVAGAVPRARIPAEALALLEGASIAHASNSWVVGGSRTRSGKPIVANDTHLALRTPSIWYLAALHGGSTNVTGMTIAGIPVVAVGHNGRVAWGVTNAMVDDVDFYVEQVDAGDSTRYRTPGGWERFVVRPETIQVKGGERVIHPVRFTRHGPVLSDVEERAAGRVLSMRWTAYEPTREVQGLLAMNRARNAAEFSAALRDFSSPHMNVVFADAEGHIGYWMGGLVPVRRAASGLLPLPGWTDEGDWVRFLDFDEHPHVVDPADGFVVTANNRQAGPAYPFRISNDWADPWRALRIRQMVQPARGLTADSVAAQQMDVTDLFARRHLPLAVRTAERAGLADVAKELRGWDGRATADSHAAAVYYAWLQGLRVRIADDEFRGGEVYFPRATLDRILLSGQSPWIDDVTTDSVETLDGLSAAAMRAAVEAVGGHTWGQVHTTEMPHPLGAVAALNHALGLNVGPFANGGSGTTVNVAGYGGSTPPFVNRYGPSQRMVIDLADPDGSGGFVLPTGQSGNPFSPHYRDQTPLWREGRLWRIPLDRDKAEARIVRRATLRPR